MVMVAFILDTTVLDMGHCPWSLDIAVLSLTRMNSELCILHAAGHRFRI